MGDDQAVAAAEQRLADRIRTIGPDHPETLAARGDLADHYDEAYRYGDAVALNEQNLAARTRDLAPDHPDTMHTRHGLVYGYNAMGRYIESNRRGGTEPDRTRVLGPDHGTEHDDQRTAGHAAGECSRSHGGRRLLNVHGRPRLSAPIKASARTSGSLGFARRSTGWSSDAGPSAFDGPGE